MDEFERAQDFWEQHNTECRFRDSDDGEEYILKECRDVGSMWSYVYLLNGVVWLVLTLTLIQLELSLLCCTKC